MKSKRKDFFRGLFKNKNPQCIIVNLRLARFFIPSSYLKITFKFALSLLSCLRLDSFLIFFPPIEYHAFDYFFLLIHVYVFKAASHFSILIQLCIFMNFTTISYPYFYNCQGVFVCVFNLGEAFQYSSFWYLQYLPIISAELISAFIIHLFRTPLQMLN